MIEINWVIASKETSKGATYIIKDIEDIQRVIAEIFRNNPNLKRLYLRGEE